ncbi:MAG: hypothetical protein AAF298_00335 [Cyanobacteria bacterium P01_A01_bin.40]
MSEVNRFFNDEIKAIAADSNAIASQAASELKQEIQQQIRRNFNNPSAAFANGVKIYEFDTASSYVRLSSILSSHAQEKNLSGNPNLWILLPDGVRLGFKRMGTHGFNWDTLKRNYGSRLSFVPVSDGHVVLFRSPRSVVPVYKIQAAVRTKQRIRFYEAAEEIANDFGMEVIN